MAFELISRPFVRPRPTIVDYLQGEVKPRMLWKPSGVVMHNTGAPKLSQWPGKDTRGQPITVETRLRNLYHYYANQLGWKAGPHFFVDRDFIWAFSVPWKPGTHSPSWNKTHFGVELVGDYDTEIMPSELRNNALALFVGLYKLMGIQPTDTNFRYHKEDPRTSHKRCPGANVGPKSSWLRDVASGLQAAQIS